MNWEPGTRKAPLMSGPQFELQRENVNSGPIGYSRYQCLMSASQLVCKGIYRIKLQSLNSLCLDTRCCFLWEISQDWYHLCMDLTSFTVNYDGNSKIEGIVQLSDFTLLVKCETKRKFCSLDLCIQNKHNYE